MFLYRESIGRNPDNWSKLAIRNVYLQCMGHLTKISVQWKIQNPAGIVNPFENDAFHLHFVKYFYKTRYGAIYNDNVRVMREYAPVVWHTKRSSPILCVGIARAVVINDLSMNLNQQLAQRYVAPTLNTSFHSNFRVTIGTIRFHSVCFSIGNSNVLSNILMRAYLSCLIELCCDGRAITVVGGHTDIKNAILRKKIYGEYTMGHLYNRDTTVLATRLQNMFKKFDLDWFKDDVQLRESTDVLQDTILRSRHANGGAILTSICHDIDRNQFTLLMKRALESDTASNVSYVIPLTTDSTAAISDNIDQLISECDDNIKWKNILQLSDVNGCITTGLLKAILELRLFWVRETNAMIEDVDLPPNMRRGQYMRFQSTNTYFNFRTMRQLEE